MERTFEQYLRDAHAAGAIDHAVRARVDPNGAVSFYIHPAGRDGETLDFVVGGNGLSCIQATGSNTATRIGAANVS